MREKKKKKNLSKEETYKTPKWEAAAKKRMGPTVTWREGRSNVRTSVLGLRGSPHWSNRQRSGH